MIEGFELDAAVFRRLLQHLNQDRLDTADADLMNLAGFSRERLADWYQEAAAERLLYLSQDEAREAIYGMPYADWLAHCAKASRAA